VALALAPTFRDSARLAAELATSAQVRERWAGESACAGMSTGGLAHHLQDQTRNTIRLFAAEPHDQAPITVEEHYRRAAWVHTSLDGEVNAAIARGSDEEAVGGPDVLAEQVREQLAALPAALAAVDDDRPVLVPWQGWALTAHDFAVTRLMEILVHADDLAASVDLPTPQFPDEAVRVVLGLLTSVALERHGQTALVRALSRPQRAPATVAAFG
jgi:hypothetical protein